MARLFLDASLVSRRTRSLHIAIRAQRRQPVACSIRFHPLEAQVGVRILKRICLTLIVGSRYIRGEIGWEARERRLIVVARD